MVTRFDSNVMGHESIETKRLRWHSSVPASRALKHGVHAREDRVVPLPGLVKRGVVNWSAAEAEAEPKTQTRIFRRQEPQYSCIGWA